ncbi:MAG: 3-dehydroquinate synthase [Phycisphaerae bacterium]|nr:3-dehydroquinate synthase [Phycisphaerae bacterium]
MQNHMDQPRPDQGGAQAGSFSVQWDHRLITTRDALAPGNDILSSLLPTDKGPSRMIACLDQGLVEAHPELPAQVELWADANAHLVRLMGKVATLPGGEDAKNDFNVFNETARLIDAHGICRKSFVLVAGGGAFLDAVGYAASSAHRGVRVIRMPSTTLSQGDAGVGVKNGINAFGKKNFLGSFSPPWAVVNDTNLLSSLSDRDWRSGLSEAVKVALLKDAAFFDELRRLAARTRTRDLDAMEGIVERSAHLHMKHIIEGGDAFERFTARPLDFGHWSAHKLEQMSGFDLKHGEAVAIGLLIDLTYAAMIGRLDESVLKSTRCCLLDMGFTLQHEALGNHEVLLEGLREFREHLGGQLTITLVEEIGKPLDVHEIDLNVMRRAIDDVRSVGLNESSRVG